MYEEYGNLRGDRLLNIEQLFGEVLANVMGDLKIRASGIFYDIDKYEGIFMVHIIFYFINYVAVTVPCIVLICCIENE